MTVWDDMGSSFAGALKRHQTCFDQLPAIADQVQKVAQDLLDTVKRHGKVVFLGNGGSAADSQHLAAELVVRYKDERRPLSALALTANTSVLTAHGNDYDYSTVFSRQVQALVRSEDLLIGLSTSGSSPNVLDAVSCAMEIGARCWVWTNQDGGQAKALGCNILRVPSSETARVQEAHMFVGHWLCEYLDYELSGR